MRKLLVLALILGTISQAQLVRGQEGFPEEEFDEPPTLQDNGFSGLPPPPPPPPVIDSNGNMIPNGASPSPAPSFGGSSGSSFGGSSPRRFGGSPAKTTPAPKGKSGMDLAHANPEDITDENFPDLIESFDYPNADIKDVIKAMSELTGKNFILDNNVSGKITIIAPTRITVAEAYKAFLAALAVNSLTIVPSGKFLKITNSRQAMRNNIETYSGSYYPTSDVMITRILQLKYIAAKDVNDRLRQLVTKDGEMYFYEQTNSLIIADYGSNVERLAKIISELDRPGFEEQLEVIVLKYAKARDIADIVSQVINKESSGGKNSRFAPRIPRFNQPGQTKGGGAEQLSMVTPDERTNSLIVLGNKAGLEKVKQLVKKLDFRLSPEDAGGVFVYYVKFGEAEKIAQTLNGVAGDANKNKNSQQQGAQTPPGFLPPVGQTPTGGDEGAGLFGGEVKITAEKLTNSLIITASKTDFEIVKNILAKIDIPRDQVYVDAVIMDMSANRSNVWGVNAYQFGNDGKGNAVGRTGFSSGSLTDILTPPANGQEGGVMSFANGETLSLMGPAGQAVKITSLAGFIKFVTQVGEASVLSNPRLVATNNEESEIEVGQKVPIGTDVTTGTAGTTSQSIKFENASIKLTLTPFVSPNDNTVRMKVKQIVSEVVDAQVKAENLAKNTQTLATRTVNTNLSVKSGDTAIMGGLIRNEDSVQITKVPLLGDIPIIGWLFKGQTVKRDRRNLVVLITPKILRSIDHSHQVLDTRLDERVDFIKENLRGTDPFGKRVENLPRLSPADASKPILRDDPIVRIPPPSETPQSEPKVTGQAEGNTQELIEETLETF